MNDDEPHEIWYYSHGDEKCGPVSFTDLRALAKNATLNPRHDLVWTKGMDEWKPAGEIEGLFKRRTPEPPEVPVPAVGSAPAADPYRPPGDDELYVPPDDQGTWPGARRRSYLFAVFILPLLMNFGIVTITTTFQDQIGQQIAGMIALGVMALTWIVILYVSIQRFPNLGMSRWWFFGNLVPFFNIWLGYRCFACPAGYAVHKKLDGIGIFLAIVYWLLILVVVLAVAAVIALLFGAIGSPEIQQQFQEGFRKAMEAGQQQQP